MLLLSSESTAASTGLGPVDGRRGVRGDWGIGALRAPKRAKRGLKKQIESEGRKRICFLRVREQRGRKKREDPSS